LQIGLLIHRKHRYFFFDLGFDLGRHVERAMENALYTCRVKKGIERIGAAWAKGQESINIGLAV
jgi:hypothetical protein